MPKIPETNFVARNVKKCHSLLSQESRLFANKVKVFPMFADGHEGKMTFTKSCSNIITG